MPPRKRASTAVKEREEVSKRPSGTTMNFRPAGATGLKRVSGEVFEEFDPALQGQKAIKVFKEMRENDPVIGAMFFSVEMFLRRVQWFIDANPDEEDDQKAADDKKFLEECMDDMSMTWPDFISEIMSMLEYGWVWFEILYKIRRDDVDADGNAKSKYNDGKTGWRKFDIRSQDSWDKWDFDDEGGIRGMYQRPAPDYDEKYIPISKSVLFRTTSKKNNPEGRSVLRNAYRPWYFKKRVEEIEGIGVERDMAGLPFAEVPAEMLSENASEADKATLASIIELVKNVRHDEQEGVVWPQSYDENGNKMYEFKLMNSGGTRAFSTDAIITRYESRIAGTMLQDFLLLGQDSQGSFAMATSKTGMFQASLSTWLDVVQDVLNNYAVPRLFRLNGVKGPYPTFRHDEVQKPSLSDLSVFVAALAGAGAQLFPDTELENFLRRVAQMPTREESDEDTQKEDKIRGDQLDNIIEMNRINLENQKLGLQGNRAAAAAGVQPGKQPGSVPGAPTKTTGPVKSKLPPASRRNTAAVAASTNVMAKRIKIVKKRKHPQAYEEETARIRERAKLPQYKKKHKFDPAVWTHPNGHPRCKNCLQEEPISGVCDPR